MTNETFKTQIARLCEQWESSYSGERVGSLWGALQRTPDDVFERAVTQCLLNHRTAPLLDDLRDEIKKVYESDRSARTSSQALLNQPKGCSLCVDGYYFDHAEDGYVYTYRCSCPAGAAMPALLTFPNGQTKLLPQWKGHSAH